MPGLESLDNRVPPTLDRRLLLEVALGQHDCRRLTPFATNDDHYAFCTVDSLMVMLEAVAQPGEGRLWSHGDKIDEARCPGATWPNGEAKTYADTLIQVDLHYRMNLYCESKVHGEQAELTRADDYPLHIVSYTPKTRPDFVLGTVDSRTDEVIISLVADHYSSSITTPVTPQRAMFIEEALVQSLVHLLSARQAFGTFFSVVLHNRCFSRIVMLNEQCIAVETTGELYHTRGLDHGPYSRVVPLAGLLSHPVFLANLLAHDFPSCLAAAGDQVTAPEHAWFTFILYAVRVLRAHSSPSEPLKFPAAFRALLGQRLGFANPNASHSERLGLIKERWYDQHSGSGCLCFLAEPNAPCSSHSSSSGWTTSSCCTTTTASSSSEGCDRESSPSGTAVPLGVQPPSPDAPLRSPTPSYLPDDGASFIPPPPNMTDDQAMHEARKDILLRQDLFIVLMTPREMDSILAASLGPAPVYRVAPEANAYVSSIHSLLN
ncbi:uncharacterized protein LOC62_04G006098 [Vanrija pseudolonga]|uniref:Uncharacterized protein n=1 Tax=Vanrija pseudolonga TaxID=143232 RepID=A0AAF1BRU2_9TREE|nr:hypothetical protein LOC62_04G006098 [Vanrija pseudolonga]